MEWCNVVKGLGTKLLRLFVTIIFGILLLYSVLHLKGKIEDLKYLFQPEESSLHADDTSLLSQEVYRNSEMAFKSSADRNKYLNDEPYDYGLIATTTMNLLTWEQSEKQLNIATDNNLGENSVSLVVIEDKAYYLESNENLQQHEITKANVPFDLESENGIRKENLQDNNSKIQPQIENPNRICSHKERRDHVNKVCETMPGFGRGHSRFLVDHKRKLVFCEVSKSGCTTWKVIWERANNGTLADRLQKGSLVEIHQASNERKGGLFSEHYWNSTWDTQNYTKFIVVRHPMDRTVSAYYNLVNWDSRNPGPDQGVMHAIRDFYNLTSTKNLTFEQFVTYITNPSSNHYYDRHWSSFRDSCQLCTYNYDYIIRLETVEFDSSPVLNIMGYNNSYSKSFPTIHGISRINNAITENSNSAGTSKIGTKYLKEYTDLPEELISKLIARYRVDMDILGYGFNEKTATTTCSIESEKGDNCC